MARPQKRTVDYFPHIISKGKTLTILENRFGNDGYAFWFKLLEILGSTDGHAYHYKNTVEVEFLLAKTRVNRETADAILQLLADLGAIDAGLWKRRVIWSDNFVECVADAYKRRTVPVPQKPTGKEVSAGRNAQGGQVSEDGNTQSKVKKSKGDKESCPPSDVVDLWNDTCAHILPRVQLLTDKRRTHIRARSEGRDMDWWRELFGLVMDSPFLRGEEQGKWRATFDWLIKSPDNCAKVFEGHYRQKGAGGMTYKQVRAPEGWKP